VLVFHGASRRIEANREDHPMTKPYTELEARTCVALVNAATEAFNREVANCESLDSRSTDGK
jgi:hypothetical protein